jgi:hypothetical protein
MSRLSHGQLVLELASCVQHLSAFLDLPETEDDNGSFESQYARIGERAERILDGISKSKLGRGNSKVGRRGPKVEMPSQQYYDSYIRAPEAFTNLCAFTPGEFEDLHNDVLDVLQLSRNSSCLFTDEENALRKKRHFKFSSRERLFHFLMFCRQYPA